MELYLDPPFVKVPKQRKPHPLKGKHQWITEDPKKKERVMSGLRKGWYMSKKGRHATRSTSVSVYDLEGKFVMACETIKQAGQVLGLSRSCISMCVTGKTKRAGKYIFRKADVVEFRGMKLVKKSPIEPYKRTCTCLRKKQDPAIIKDPDMLDFIENYKTNRP